MVQESWLKNCSAVWFYSGNFLDQTHTFLGPKLKRTYVNICWEPELAYDHRSIDRQQEELLKFKKQTIKIMDEGDFKAHIPEIKAPLSTSDNA